MQVKKTLFPAQAKPRTLLLGSNMHPECNGGEKMLNVKTVVGSVVQQASFNEEGSLHVQKCLVSYMQRRETSTGQATLDKWLR